MGQLIILGSSNALPDQDHGNTHMLIREGDHNILVDCAGDVIQRLQRIDFEFDSLTEIILTHFHPDHVSGAPLLLMGMWLMGRKRPLKIYGSLKTLTRMEATMDFYEWGTWPNFYPVSFNQVKEEEMAPVIEDSQIHIYASPVNHFLPTMGLRFEFMSTGRTVAYSCDTEPCPQVTRLAQNVDILLNEATGKMVGHTSSAQAAEIATQANVKNLYLIHYQARGAALQTLVKAAREIFPGRVELATDFLTLEL